MPVVCIQYSEQKRARIWGRTDREESLMLKTCLSGGEPGNGRKSKSREERRRQRRAAMECAAFFGCIALACGLESWIG